MLRFWFFSFFFFWLPKNSVAIRYFRGYVKDRKLEVIGRKTERGVTCEESMVMVCVLVRSSFAKDVADLLLLMVILLSDVGNLLQTIHAKAKIFWLWSSRLRCVMISLYLLSVTFLWMVEVSDAYLMKILFSWNRPWRLKTKRITSSSIFMLPAV